MGGLKAADAKQICKIIRMQSDKDMPEKLLATEVICTAVMDALGQGFAHEYKTRELERRDARDFFFDGRALFWGEFVGLHPDFLVGLLKHSKADWLKGKNGSNKTERGHAPKTAAQSPQRGAYGLGTRVSRGPFDTRGQRANEGRNV